MMRHRRPSELAKRRARRTLTRLARRPRLPGEFARIARCQSAPNHPHGDVGDDYLTADQWWDIQLVNDMIDLERARTGVRASAAPTPNRCGTRARRADRPAARRPVARRGGDSSDGEPCSSAPPPDGRLTYGCKAVRP
jgi:hypothetical protein